jgi:hypothetical protein
VNRAGTSIGQDVAIVLGTVCLLEGLKFAFGWPVAFAVASTSLVFCIAFLWFAGKEA